LIDTDNLCTSVSPFTFVWLLYWSIRQTNMLIWHKGLMAYPDLNVIQLTVVVLYKMNFQFKLP